MSDRKLDIEGLYNLPDGKVAEGYHTEKVIKGILSDIHQEYEKDQLLQVLPIVDEETPDLDKMFEIPLKNSGTLLIGAIQPGRIRRPIIGFTGKRFPSLQGGEVFMTETARVADETINDCGKLNLSQDIDWDSVSTDKIGELIRVLWKKD